MAGKVRDLKVTEKERLMTCKNGGSERAKFSKAYETLRRLAKCAWRHFQTLIFEWRHHL